MAGKRTRGAWIAAALAIVATAVLSSIGVLATAARAADTPPAGVYEGTIKGGRWVFRVSCSGACTIHPLPETDQDVQVTRVSDGHYRGQLADCYIPHLYDVRFSGRTMTMHMTSQGGNVPKHCDGSPLDSGETVHEGPSAWAFTGTLVGSDHGSGTSAASSSPSGAQGATSSVAGLSRSQIASRIAAATERRSLVPASLTEPSESMKNGKRVVQNLLLAALLVLLLVFPSQLFNSTYDANHERIDAAVRKRFRRGEKSAATLTPGRRAVNYCAVVGAGALLAVFLDPHAKFNAATIAFFVGVCATTLFGLGVSGALSRWYRRTRRHPTDATLHAVPAGLVIAFLCVVISRSVHFAPGYLYGLVGGFVFASALSRREEGQAQSLGFLVGLGMALVAWFAFIPLGHAANHPHASFQVLVADSFVGAVFIGGIEGALFSLVPLRFLPGHAIAKWSWATWIATAAVTAFLFVNVLLRPENGYLGKSSTASAVVTYGLFAAFGLASIAFWAYFRSSAKPPTTDVDPEPTVGLAVSEGTMP